MMYIRDPSIPARLAEQHQPLYQFLLNKWYFDEIYDFLPGAPRNVDWPLPSGRRGMAG